MDMVSIDTELAGLRAKVEELGAIRHRVEELEANNNALRSEISALKNPRRAIPAPLIEP